MIKRSGVDDVVEVTEQRSLVEVVVKFYLSFIICIIVVIEILVNKQLTNS